MMEISAVVLVVVYTRVPDLGCRHPLGVSHANPGGVRFVSGNQYKMLKVGVPRRLSQI